MAKGFPSLDDENYEELPHYNEIPTRKEVKLKLSGYRYRNNPCCESCAEGGPCEGSKRRRNPQNFEVATLQEARNMVGGGPFRAPHWTASAKALAEEVRLANGGVLYLLDLAEFSQRGIESITLALRAVPNVRIVVSPRPEGPWSERWDRFVAILSKRKNPDPFSTLYPEKGLFARRKARNPDPFSTLYPERGLFSRNPENAWCERCGVEINSSITGLCSSCKDEVGRQESTTKRRALRRRYNPDPFDSLYPERGLFSRKNPVFDTLYSDTPFDTSYLESGSIWGQNLFRNRRSRRSKRRNNPVFDNLYQNTSKWTDPLFRRKRNPFFQKNGSSALACSNLCFDSYKSDLENGLIYGPYILNGKHISPEEFSTKTGHCIYCGKIVGSESPISKSTTAKNLYKPVTISQECRDQACSGCSGMASAGLCNCFCHRKEPQYGWAKNRRERKRYNPLFQEDLASQTNEEELYNLERRSHYCPNCDRRFEICHECDRNTYCPSHGCFSIHSSYKRKRKLRKRFK